MRNVIAFIVCLVVILQNVNCGLVQTVLQKLHNVGNRIIPHEHHHHHHDESCTHDHHDHGDLENQENVVDNSGESGDIIASTERNVESNTKFHSFFLCSKLCNVCFRNNN